MEHTLHHYLAAFPNTRILVLKRTCANVDEYQSMFSVTDRKLEYLTCCQKAYTLIVLVMHTLQKLYV